MAVRVAVARSLPRQTFRQVVRQRPHARFNSSQATPPPPPPPPQKGSWTLPLVGVLALASAGGYYYYKQSGLVDGTAPASELPIAAGKKGAEQIGKPGDYQAVYDAIAESLEEGAEEYDDGSFGPVILRLAWHASGTYDKETGTGGSNGATMRFAPEGDHGANAGLKLARDHLERIKEKFSWITYSDLWTLAGVCALQEMGGPIIPWRPGRSDKDVSACTPDGRLPDGAKGARHIRDIFYRMGFSDQEIVALCGAHALGRCHPDRSGFKGPWTFSPTILTNDYYKLLVSEKWVWKKTDENSEGKVVKWVGPAQYEDKTTRTLMMLPADYSLVQDKTFKKWVETYANDKKKFFNDFSAVIAKLFELGVPFKDDVKPILFKKTANAYSHPDL